jgi:hypothetical protein
LSPRAKRSKDGPGSGIDRQISRSSGPLYSLAHPERDLAVRSLGHLVGADAAEQTERHPPAEPQVSRGSNRVTLTGNARPDAACERILTVSFTAIRPSTASTPESQFGQLAPSLSTAHTASGLAAIVDVAW